jgi:predicted RNA binding protein YcfA (HicA-like mRNA interferase family)
MKTNPKDWKIEQLIPIASEFGFSARMPGKGGSHVTFRHSSGARLTVPAHRPIKPIYIKKFLALIEEVTRL